MWLFHFLQEDDQLYVETFAQRRVINGPGVFFTNPFSKVTRRKGTLLSPTEFVFVEDILSGVQRVERGPQLFFLGVNDRILKKETATTLNEHEYIHLKNQISGAQREVRGPQLVFLEVGDEVIAYEKAHNLRENDYLYVKDLRTGIQRIERGPQSFFPSVNDLIAKEGTAITLRKDQYVRVLDKRSGIQRVERGESRIFVQPDETILVNKDLSNAEVEAAQATARGTEPTSGLTALHGPPSHIPEQQPPPAKATAPTGQETVATAPKIDDQVAVLVRDIASGQLSLITEPGLFFPTPYQVIVELRQRVRLADYQIVVVKDKDGRQRVRRGTDTERSFFLAPYEEIVPFIWSSGLHKDKRALRIEALDLRPKFMWYEFEARTEDNVELTLGITFFWQVSDVEAMIRTTDDTTGDICSHARSSIIQAVSQVTLERFLAEFNDVVRRVVVESSDPFYRERGAVLHASEVRSIQCKDPQTQEILNEIIQETTNRLNRLQKQESENEVRLRQIQGETEVEQSRAELLNLQRANAINAATSEGEAEAQRVGAFLSGLGEQLSLEQKIAAFNLLRKGDILDTLSKGTAHLYFTPADVDLSIESKTE